MRTVHHIITILGGLTGLGLKADKIIDKAATASSPFLTSNQVWQIILSALIGAVVAWFASHILSWAWQGLLCKIARIRKRVK